MLDAFSDKLLNGISFIILGIEYNIMFAPLILELSILYTNYSANYSPIAFPLEKIIEHLICTVPIPSRGKYYINYKINKLFNKTNKYFRIIF